MDIFPLDYYPENAWRQFVFGFRLKALECRIRSAFTLREENRKSPVAEFALRAASAVLSVLFPRVEDALDAREKLYRSVPRSRLLANRGGAWGKKEIVPAGWYGEGTVGEFEGIKTTLPLEYDQWLRQVYGDYWRLPPEEKRVVHHYTEVIDLDNPYTEYLREFET